MVTVIIEEIVEQIPGTFKRLWVSTKNDVTGKITPLYTGMYEKRAGERISLWHWAGQLKWVLATFREAS